MRLLLALLSLVSLVWCVVEIDEGVYVLTDENYDSFTAENNMFLVEVYAPWCGHCKRLAPDYAKAAGMLAAANSDAKLAKVDGTVSRGLASTFGVQGYPTLKFYRDGHLLEFTGERTADAIYNWVLKKSASPSQAISTAAELKEVTSSVSSTTLVAYLSEKKLSKFNVGIGLDDIFSHLKIYTVSDKDLWGDAKAGTLQLFVPGKEVQQLAGPFSENKAYAWLATNAFPGVCTEEQARARSKALPKLDLLVVYLEKGEETPDFLEAFAKSHPDVIVGKSDNPAAPETQGCSGKLFPTAVYTHKKKTTIWNEDDESVMTLESLTKFAKESVAGTYFSYIKSEPIPADNDGPVTVLVGRTIEEVAFDADKDVLVEFYAPWCGHCKNLAPIYEELGSAFGDDPNVVIAKIDATANKVPSKFAVQGFPTLIFVPANRNKKASKPITYQGDRTLEAMQTWISQNRVSPSTNPEL